MARYMKCLVGGLALFAFGVSFGWLLFPTVLYSQMHQQLQLKNGTPTRDLWSKFPFFLENRLWLFNYTNPNEIASGAKPIIREVGPFFYEKWQEKVDLIDREEDDTVEYSFKNTWIFDPSKGLSGEEELIIPHSFILLLAMTVIRDKPAMVPIIGKAIDSIFKKPSSVFVKVKAREILFDGLPIDCTVTDFAGGAVCTLLRDKADSLQVDSPDHYRFSFFGARNASASKKRMRVIRGVGELEKIGVVVEYDGKDNIDKWNDSKCDEFRGTDGTIFHPFFKEKEELVSFAPDICRSLAAYDDGTIGMVAGIQTKGYTIDIGDPEKFPEQKCYCDGPDNCLGKGLMDLFKCIGAPFIISHPHFYQADPSYLQMVDGLNPSKEDHEIKLDFVPLMGMPVAARSRIQFNMMIHPVEKLKFMRTLPEALLPLFWLEESIILPDFFTNQIKDGVNTVIIARYLTLSLISMGLTLCIFAIFIALLSSKKRQKMDVTKVSKAPITTVQVPSKVE